MELKILNYLKKLLGISKTLDKTNQNRQNDYRKNQTVLNSGFVLSKKIIDASQFGIKESVFSKNVIFILNKLHEAGYHGYVVGGSIRDLLLNKKPKDFDVSTDARPEQLKALFGRQCRIVGKRFKIVHIILNREIIEVTTFRGDSNSQISNNNYFRANEEGMLLRDNVYGCIEQDVLRRDFTVNALYYDITNNTIYDFLDSIADIQKSCLKIIGRAESRYQEDPVRILRTIYFMVKLDFYVEETSKLAMMNNIDLLSKIPPARLFNESIKLLQTGYGVKIFTLLCKYDVFKYLFPLIAKNFTEKKDSNIERMIWHTLENTDERIKDNLPVNPAFLFASFYWYLLTEKIVNYRNEGGLLQHDAINISINDILTELYKTLAVPKRYTVIIREIWELQFSLKKRYSEKQVMRSFARNKFRAGFDLLLMRASIEKNDLIEVGQWWHEYQFSNDKQKQDMINKQKKKRPFFPNKNKFNKNPSTKLKKQS